MATNTGNKSRKGAIKERSQVQNPSTGHYVKRDSLTGKFLEVKPDGKPFKGVRKEKINIKANPSIKSSTAKKAETAAISVINKRKFSQ